MSGYETYSHNQIQYAYQSIDEAFPAIDPGIEPFGNFVLMQLRKPKTKTAGGIILSDEARATESDNTQVAKIVALGQLCFKNPDTLEPWPEGDWVKPGDFVRHPKFGGDRFTVKDTDGVEVQFRLYAVKDIIGKVTGDPLAVKAFI